MKRMLALASLLVFSGCVSDIQTGEPEGATGVTKSAIQLGSSLTLSDGYYASVVVRLTPWSSIENDFVTCSGTVVHPNWVLTAAHCVDPDYDSFTVYPYSGTPKLVDYTVIHPDAAPYGDIATEYVDVALAHVNSAFGQSHGWNPESADIDQLIVCYGYGLSGAGTGLGTLRKASFTIFEDWGRGDDERRYKINRNGFYQIQLGGDSGGPCFDVATGKQTGVQSTIHGIDDEVLQAEQVKMTHIEDWITEVIEGR